ncbi:hypothetical protein AOLI_G00222080 [Acnodon oligacanthus]
MLGGQCWNDVLGNWHWSHSGDQELERPEEQLRDSETSQSGDFEVVRSEDMKTMSRSGTIGSELVLRYITPRGLSFHRLLADAEWM